MEYSYISNTKISLQSNPRIGKRGEEEESKRSMEEHGEKPYLMNCPSFGSPTSDDVIDRDRFISAVHPEEEEAVVDGDDDDFEFAIVAREPDGDPSITAAGGWMFPVYPVFNRDLLANDSTSTTRSGSISSTSSEADELAAAAEHCVWSPRPAEHCDWSPRPAAQAPERCQKSASTGSSRRWRIRDLMVGRSHSDGKEKFAFLGSHSQEKEKSPNRNPTATADTKGAKKGKKGTTEMDMVTAHRLYYSKVGGGQRQGGRRSFLPYRQDLVGFFAGVNGFSGSQHPY
ncbi:uncharacterized protein [Typha angustifolia]|uniref:uncharacterized protein n=1 Tax=Typha angustifolia TaxID=59011 RepID=UPI003C2C2282